MDRVAWWKTEFERCFRCGDRQGMAHAEMMIEQWRLAASEGITLIEEDEAQGGPVQQ